MNTMGNSAVPSSPLSRHAVQPRQTATVAEHNAERLHTAVSSAWHEGYDMGEHIGYLAGARAGRFAAFCWGLAAGITVVAAAMYSGLLGGV